MKTYGKDRVKLLTGLLGCQKKCVWFRCLKIVHFDTNAESLVMFTRIPFEMTRALRKIFNTVEKK